MRNAHTYIELNSAVDSLEYTYKVDIAFFTHTEKWKQFEIHIDFGLVQSPVAIATHINDLLNRIKQPVVLCY